MPAAIGDVDALVIGGGLAGSAVAIRLAGMGKAVTLLEKTAAAHHKVCGEFLSIEAQAYLQRLGVDLDAAGAVPITACLLCAAGQQASIPLPFTARSLSRFRLDELLLERAAAAGATVVRGMAVASLTKKEDGWRALLADGRPLTAPTAFLATGKHDMRGWTRGQARQGRTDFIGLKMHYRLSEAALRALAGKTILFLFADGYAGLEPIEDGLANLCLVVRKKAFAACGKSWTRLLCAIATDTPQLSVRLQGAIPCWEKPLAIYGIPYGYVADRLTSANGLHRLGDQAAVIPSLFGDGMALALHTAFLATGSRGDANDAELSAVRRQIRFAAWLSRLAYVGWLQVWLVKLCHRYPGIPRLAIRLTRCRHTGAAHKSIAC